MFHRDANVDCCLLCKQFIVFCGFWYWFPWVWMSFIWSLIELLLLQLLAMLLKKKRPLLNSHILHLTFSLVGTVDSGHETSIIPNSTAFQDLLCDFEVGCSPEEFRWCCVNVKDMQQIILYVLSGLASCSLWTAPFSFWALHWTSDWIQVIYLYSSTCYSISFSLPLVLNPTEINYIMNFYGSVKCIWRIHVLERELLGTFCTVYLMVLVSLKQSPNVFVLSEAAKNAKLLREFQLIPKLLLTLRDQSLSQPTIAAIGNVLSLLLQGFANSYDLLR